MRPVRGVGIVGIPARLRVRISLGVQGTQGSG